jgi:hypothetical protein
MGDRQVIWVESGVTSFTAVCHACLADLGGARAGLGYRAALLAGSLRSDADVGFTRCRRGHRLSVRRTTSAPLRASA